MTTSALPVALFPVPGHHHSLPATTTPFPTTASSTSLFPTTANPGQTQSLAQFPPTSPALHHRPTQTTTAPDTSPPACQPRCYRPPTTVPPTSLLSLMTRSRWSTRKSRTMVRSLVWDVVGLRRLTLTTQMGSVSAVLPYNKHTLHTCNNSSPGMSTQCIILKHNPRFIESLPRRLILVQRAKIRIIDELLQNDAA